MGALSRYKPSAMMTLLAFLFALLLCREYLFGSPALPEPSVADILTATPRGHGEYLWGDYDMRLQLGTVPHKLIVSNADVIDSTTGQMMADPIGGSLNPSLLRLPRGSQWQYLGACWGPARHKIRLGAPSREPTIAL